MAAAANTRMIAGSGATDLAGAGSKREIPAAAASAISVAHVGERREHGEENMTGEGYQELAISGIGMAADCD